MKKRIITLLLLLAALAGLLCGCVAAEPVDGAAGAVPDLTEAYGESRDAVSGQEEYAEEPDNSPAPAEDAPRGGETGAPMWEGVPESTAPSEQSGAAIAEDGEYTSPEDVAEYLHTYGKLPGNFLSKNAARDLGWDSSKGNLWDVAPGKSIGGDHFGNYEGLLPEGRYRECDVNYAGGYRGAERLIYGEDGGVWYTNDHYRTFTQLY